MPFVTCFSDDKNCFSETQLRHHRMCLIGLHCHTSGTRSSPDYLCVRPSFYQSQGIIKWACPFLSPALGHLHLEEVHLPPWQCLHHLVVIRTARSVKRKALILISERHFSCILIHPNTNSMVCTFTGSRGCACHFLCCTRLSAVVATGCDISTAWRTFTLSCCTYSILSNTTQTHSKAGEKM